MNFIEALFALFISSTGVPVDCNGSVAFMPDSIQACQQEMPVAQSRDSKPQLKIAPEEETSPLDFTKIQKKISNGF